MTAIIIKVSDRERRERERCHYCGLFVSVPELKQLLPRGSLRDMVQLFHHTGKLLYIVVTIDHFYIVLFSALEQTHCTLVAYDSVCF